MIMMMMKKREQGFQSSIFKWNKRFCLVRETEHKAQSDPEPLRKRLRTEHEPVELARPVSVVTDEQIMVGLFRLFFYITKLVQR